MKQGDQEKKNHSLQHEYRSPSPSHVKIVIRNNGLQSVKDFQQVQGQNGFEIDLPRDENVFEENMYEQQKQKIIKPEYTKNVSSRPPPIQTPKEAVPQFSTNPDQDSPNLAPIDHNPGQMLQAMSGRPLVTQFGRQLSGNIDMDLNFRKKANAMAGNTIQNRVPTISAKKVRRNDTHAQNKDSDISPITANNTNSGVIANKKPPYYQKNPTQKIYDNHSNLVLQPFQGGRIINGKNAKGMFGQQRTINLNFFDDLQIGFDSNGPANNVNYEIISSIKGGPEPWFDNANFSVIQQNPKGSEFIDGNDYEDEKIYESREMGYTPPLQMDSVNGNAIIGGQNNYSGTKSPILMSNQNSPTFKNHRYNPYGGMLSDRIEPENRAEELIGFEQDPMNNQFQKHMTIKSAQNNYATQNQDSEIDQFLPRVNLLVQNDLTPIINPKAYSSQPHDIGNHSLNHLNTLPSVDKNLLIPRNIKASTFLAVSGMNSSKENSMISKMSRRFEASVMHVDVNEDNSEILKRLEVDMDEKPQLDDKRARMMIVNQLQAYKEQGAVQDNSFFMVVEKNPIEKVDDIEGKCSDLLKVICTIRININHLALAIIKSRLFEAASLIVIVANSVTLAIEDPTSEVQPYYQDVMDTIFLILYSLEMVLKILGLGFLFNKGAYLRDAWNILDFTIVMTGYLSLILQGGSVNLAGLRAFRVLRPLKSISSIEGLKVIVSALLSSLPLLRDTVIVLLFFFFIFAIAGLQLFSGILKRRCVNIETGVPHPDDDFCGFVDCPPGYFCGKRVANPNYDQTNFDTIFYSLIAIFTSVTLEGWTSLMFAVNKTFTNIAWIFFIPLVFIGAFFLMNLTLAVIKSKFSKEHEKRNEEKKKNFGKKKGGNALDFENLDEEEKQKLLESQLESRNKVLLKWKMIMFIKQRMRNRIKHFKERKNNETKNKLGMTHISSAFDQNHTPHQQHVVDYGMLFGQSILNFEVKDPTTLNPPIPNDLADSPQNLSFRENDTQQSQRQLIQNYTKASQQISLAPLGNGIDINSGKNSMAKSLNIQNLRFLNQDAIEEEDDEYKTEFSNIMGHHLQANGQHFSKQLRQASFGSKSSPKSNENNAIISRRSSSKLQIHFNQQQQQLTNEQRITIISPERNERKMNLVGMQGNRKKRNSKTTVHQSRKNNPYKIDDQFFKDFISKDLNTLEQMFSEQELLDIAEKLDDRVNIPNSSRFVEQFNEEYNQQFSDMSINSDEFRRSNGNLLRRQENDHTPFTSTTKNNYNRQRSKNTQHNFLSEDLSISEVFETGNDYNQPMRVQSGKDDIRIGESPQTYQNISNEIINSNEIPLNRRITDFENQNQDQNLIPRDQLVNNEPATGTLRKHNQKQVNQKTETSTINLQNNLSGSNLTTTNQNGTIHSDAHLAYMVKSKKAHDDIAQSKSRNFSNKITPAGAGTYKQADEDIPKARHGTNTIYNPDIIPIEKSVLNIRFLINQEINKHEKVYLRKDKFDFMKSQEDIFEQREAIQKQVIREQKKREATEYSKKWKIKPYQRKMTLTPKFYSPDEEQCEYLQHIGMEASDLVQLIQEQYNAPFITNLHVTGTLSIAIHDKKDVKKNGTRRIQDVDLQRKFYEDELFNETIDQPQLDFQGENQENNTMYNAGANTLNSQFGVSPLRRNKTTMSQKPKGGSTKIRSIQDQLAHDIKTQIFMKSQVSEKISKSHVKSEMQQSSVSELKRRMGIRPGDPDGALDSAAKRERLLNKAASKDPKLQRKLILSGINKDVYRSSIFRPILIGRKNRMTPEEVEERPCIQGMLDIYKDEEDEEEEEEDGDASSSDEDAIKDDFLDWPIDCKVEVLKAKKKAVLSKKNLIQWSGQDVLQDYDPQLAIQAIQMISLIRVWPKSIYGYWKRFQVRLKNFVKGAFFDNFMTLAVFMNTVVLGLDRYGIPDSEQEVMSVMNTCFTWIFIIEMTFKIVGLGPIKYFKDKMNYLDCTVVILSIVEMAFLSGSKTGLSAFRSIRIFRTFRVLRVARLLRSMQSMQVIISVLIKSMDSFIYLFMLLLLFIFIYALLGMQIFGGSYNFESNFNDPPGVPRTNFDNFHSAFLTTFQILTIESWPSLFYDALRSDVAKPISALYFISWVFLGNFMLLNLFLAILLDSFTEDAPHKSNDEDEDEKKAIQKHLENLRQMEGDKLIDYYQEVKSEDSKKNSKGGLNGGKKKKKKKKKDENLLDESFEYTEEALTKKTVTKKKKEDFEGVECELSFYILSKKNKMRTYLFRTVTHTGFETVILVLIVLSSIKLVVDTYIFDLPEDDPFTKASTYIDYFFTVAFAMESVLKSLAFGFIQDNGSYLRETWSQLDFFIVVTSLIDASFENINLPIIKILRLLRTLRPLRFISHNSGMKTIVVALLGSVSGIFNVMIVVVVVWMMFGILAVNFFGGKMQYCTVDTYLMDTKKQCLHNRGEWKTRDYNFDSLPSAMISLFALATLENWPDTMYNAINIQGLELGPKRFASPTNGYFFVIFILIGSFLFLNLFVGVIFKEFEDAQDEEKASMMLKDYQIKWVDMMKMIVNSNPDLETTNRPKQKWRAQIHTLMTGNVVDIFIMTCIVLNMIQMAVIYEGSSDEYNNVIDTINLVFTGVFTLECILKLVAFGGSYFKNSWNVFDFCVVCASNFDIVMNQLNQTSLKFLRVGPQLARVMRVLRVTRLFRLVNKYKGLQALIQTIQFSLPSLFNVFSLLMLVYFIFSVLATFLFRGVRKGIVIDEYTNFENFSSSMMTLIRISTGEDWNYVMMDCMRTEADNCIPGETCGLSYAPVFFIPYMMISTFIMLNLFILVIIQQFETYYLDENNILDLFKSDLELFKKTWTDFTSDHNCLKLKDTKLVGFFASMKAPLGMKGLDVPQIIKNVVQLDLISDDEGFVYFNELLFKSMRRVYGETHVKNKILVEHELRTLKKIEDIKKKMKKKSLQEERAQAAQVNPFMLRMYMNIIFKVWFKIYKENEERRKAEIEQNIYLETQSNASEILPNEDDEWEYKTEEDMEVSFDDGSFEEDSQGEENEDQVDSSRNLRRQTIKVDLLKTKTQSESALVKLSSDRDGIQGLSKHPSHQNSRISGSHYVDSPKRLPTGSQLRDFEVEIHLKKEKDTRRNSKNSQNHGDHSGERSTPRHSNTKQEQVKDFQAASQRQSGVPMLEIQKVSSFKQQRTMKRNEKPILSSSSRSNSSEEKQVKEVKQQIKSKFKDQ